MDESVAAHAAPATATATAETSNDGAQHHPLQSRLYPLPHQTDAAASEGVSLSLRRDGAVQEHQHQHQHQHQLVLPNLRILVKEPEPSLDRKRNSDDPSLSSSAAKPAYAPLSTASKVPAASLMSINQDESPSQSKEFVHDRFAFSKSLRAQQEKETSLSSEESVERVSDDVRPRRRSVRRSSIPISSILPCLDEVGSVGVQSGYYGMQGRRLTMEDAHTRLQHPMFNEAMELQGTMAKSFFAIYDGHGGPGCAEYCARYLHEKLVLSPSLESDPAKALIETVERTDREFCDVARRRGITYTSGTTAIIAYLNGKSLYIANVGDSRAVMGKRRGRFSQLSSDHKPNRADEMARILELGGYVGRSNTEAKAIATRSVASRLVHMLLEFCCFRSGQRRPYRVYPGGLAISRSIGDIELKTTRLIITTPEITKVSLSDDDEFMILACDGVWDVFSSADAVAEIRRFRKTKGDHPSMAAQHLTSLAYQKGSSDNISVLIVFFTHDLNVSKETK